jgi:hypothetical protein
MSQMFVNFATALFPPDNTQFKHDKTYVNYEHKVVIRLYYARYFTNRSVSRVPIKDANFGY